MVKDFFKEKLGKFWFVCVNLYNCDSKYEKYKFYICFCYR